MLSAGERVVSALLRWRKLQNKFCTLNGPRFENLGRLDTFLIIHYRVFLKIRLRMKNETGTIAFRVQISICTTVSEAKRLPALLKKDLAENKSSPIIILSFHWCLTLNSDSFLNEFRTAFGNPKSF